MGDHPVHSQKGDCYAPDFACTAYGQLHASRCFRLDTGRPFLMLTAQTLMGFGLHDIALLLLRNIVGVFFLLARFRWVYDPSRPDNPWLNKERHRHLTWKLCTCGYHWHPRMSAVVALVEVSAGTALIVGLLTVPAALALLTVLLFATVCTARQKVSEQDPVDLVDCVSCYLWRVEGVYITVVLSVLFMGPGKLSLDHLLLTLWGLL